MSENPDNPVLVRIEDPSLPSKRERVARAIYGGGDRASHSMWWGLTQAERDLYLAAADAAIATLARA